MKTLDEVIKTLELCSTEDNPCDKCPYTEFDKNGVWACSLCGDFAEDALHYLKIFRTKRDELRDLIEDYRREFKTDNPPLIWDELKTMEGKPVWVEWISGTWKGLRKWVISHGCDDLMMVFTALDVAGVSYDGHLRKMNLDKTWQAYRKERDEDA